MIRILTVVMIALIMPLLTGCETLSPERAKAEKLMGKPMIEAIKAFGNPEDMGIENGGAGTKYHGQIYVAFEHYGENFSVDTPVGGHVDYSAGFPVQVNEYERNDYIETCRVTFWADRKTLLIDYYTIKGYCGLWGSGIGNTTIFH